MENKKFELSKLDSKNLIELDGFTQSQMKLVEDHPFVEVIDVESYKQAKVNRTALKTGRTTIQSQDKLIASTVTKFRKETIAIKDELILITKPAEDLQQESIDVWENQVQAKKDADAKIEEERVEKIKNKIEVFKELFQSIIDKMTFETLYIEKDNFVITEKDAELFDFEEYEFLFDEMVSDKRTLLLNAERNLKKAESVRLERLAKDQQSKINEIKLECLGLINLSTVGNMDLLIESMNEKIICSFDFGDLEKSYDQMIVEVISEAKLRIKWLKSEAKRLKEIDVQQQKNKVINTREGLLDLVHQMTVDNYSKETIKIKETLEQDFETFVPDASEEVVKLKDRVNEALKLKTFSILDQIKKRKDETEAEERRLNDLFDIRLGMIMKAGLVHEEGFLVGFGFKVKSSFLKHNTEQEFDEWFEMMTGEIDDHKNNEVKEKAEEERMEIVMKDRIKKIKKLGMIENKESCNFSGFGHTIDISEIYEADSMDVLIVEINEYKKSDKEEKARQKKLKCDKVLMIESLEVINGCLTLNKENFKNPEAFELMSKIETNLANWLLEQNELIKSL